MFPILSAKYNSGHTLLTFANLSFKRLFSKMNVFKKIGTHDGTFHCDEVLGCYMLKLFNPEATIVRSRDEEVLKTCDIVIDVGGVYDVNQKRFDHHQRDFEHSMSTVIPGKQHTIKLSSAGLVYCHYGKIILQKILGNVDESLLETLFDQVYSDFVLEIDAIDNGVPICSGEQLYYIKTHLSARVGRLNQEWNVTDFNVDQAFLRAMEFVGKEFSERVIGLKEIWWPARKIVIDALNKRKEVHPSGEILELEQFCPWKTHLFDLEREMHLAPDIKYVIFPATQARSVYRVQSVPVTVDSFILRRPLKEEWRSLRDLELCKTSGIEGCIFVHANGFIGGNQTREGALEMAVKSLS